MPLIIGSNSGGKQPGIPTIGTATAGIQNAAVSFTAPSYLGSPTGTTYRAISSPGSLTATGASSPITVSGLTAGQAYTFTVSLANTLISSPESASSNSVTPVAPPPFFPPSFPPYFAPPNFYSDERDKESIESLLLGLEFTNDLLPVKYRWNMRDGSKVGVDEAGFIAQDFQRIQEKYGVEWLGLVDDSDENRLKINYIKLIPILVKAVQELNKEIQDIKNKDCSC